MVDSSQGNEKVQRYEIWTSEESNELLRLIVDAAKRGWRDKSGNLSKVTVEKHILPSLNAKLGTEKTYSQYKSRVKWFKKQYDKYAKLMRHNSGFGWNDVSKKFTADEHVWDEYFRSHPGDTSYKTDTFSDYEDLRIAVGCGTAIGTNSIAIGDDVEETTFETEERMENINSIGDPMLDPDSEVFVNTNNPLDDMPLSPMHSPPFAQHKSSEKRPSVRKRNRTNFEANPKSTASDSDNLTESVNKIVRALESVDTKEYNCWGIIKEIPNLDDDSRFKDAIGAIDGTHIPAMVTEKNAPSHRNRHGIISQNVLAACNFDLEFIYVLSGWEGSAHDSKILSDALTRKNGLKVPQGKWFLVDCGFPNRRQFLAPFRGTRYHLQDFSGQGRHPENAKELFNLRHASLRNVVERIFGIFKSRFTIFKAAPPFPYRTQAELVLACAGLHNFLRKECRSDEFPVDVEDGVSAEDEAQNFGPYFESQETEREAANAWRLSLATNMWNDVGNI
ncbi:Unknown protein [Striga hermonthica]|uniref:Transposase n=1 Tax=Striga hermonthica TaxID=68872 RepID=A0A9N7MXC9_STRHE|nr:Unknown protein [Striga hermonthica]CAA0833848.1 Unknown protein [Striga hermonthica]